MGKDEDAKDEDTIAAIETWKNDTCNRKKVNSRHKHITTKKSRKRNIGSGAAVNIGSGVETGKFNRECTGYNFSEEDDERNSGKNLQTKISECF